MESLADTRDAVQFAAERTLGARARAMVQPVEYFEHSADGPRRPAYLVTLENGRNGSARIEVAQIADDLAGVERLTVEWLRKYGCIRKCGRKAS